jgi:hypothetical protein
MIDVESAKEELQKKSLDEIQRETAYKWASRALAARELQLLNDHNEYVHEALEHAALVEDDGTFLLEIKKELTK